MIVRVTELEWGSCKVALVTSDGEQDSRTVATIAEAFALAGRVNADGFPVEPKVEPEVKKGKKK